MSDKRRRFIPSFDRLEDRWVPAGNVIAKIADGVLYIRGDDEANSISLIQNSNGSITLSSGSDATTINGGTDNLTRFGIDSINMKMKGGDDVVSISHLSLSHAIEIELGDGNDTLTIDHFHAEKQSAIYGQAGNDTISISHSEFHKSLGLFGGVGDDQVSTTNSYFGRGTEINGGAGTDIRNFFKVSYGSNSWIFNFQSVNNGTAPLANADTANVDQGDEVTINVAGNDLAFTGTLDLTSIVITQAPSHGTTVVNSDGTVTYTNNGSAGTTDSFKYTIKNSDGTVSNAATVNLTINQVNQAPVATNDTATDVFGGTVNIGVAANDTDAENQLDFTTITFTQQPAHGTLSLNLNGTVKYVNNGDTATSDTFKYTIKDLDGNVSNEATVTITLSANAAPVAVADTATVAEGSNVTINVASNDTDANGNIDLTSIVITQQPLHGALVINTDGTVKYTHDGSETTSDSFKYTIKDNSAVTSNEATVTITITAVNDAPVANPDTATVAQGGNVIINLATNDTDADGIVSLTGIVITQQPAHGTVVNNNNGTVTYTPTSAATSDTFTYTIKDNTGATSNTATVTITITPANAPPVAGNDDATLAVGGSKTINVASDDTDSDGTIDLTSILITQTPSNGSVVVHTDGTVTYTHDGSNTTSDSFKYTIKDNTGAVSNEATATLTIQSGDAAPVATADTDSLDEGTSKIIDLTGNDTDSDGTLDLSTLVITASPTHGSLVLHNDGTVTYTHDGSETTTDSFKYTIRDNLGSLSNEAVVTVTINPINDAPVANPDSASVHTGAGVIINLASNDTDNDNTLDLNSIVITQDPAHGTLTLHADGTVTYKHDGTATTSDSFKYTIKDTNGVPATSNEASVTISIADNQPPQAVNDTASVAKGASTIINLVGNDSDSDGTLDLASIQITQPPAHGNLVNNNDGTFTYTHDGSMTFVDVFTYLIKDNDGASSNNAVVTITIT